MAYSRAIILLTIVVFVFDCRFPNSSKKPETTTAGVKSELKGTIKISGAYALYPLISRLAEQFIVINPDVTIEVKKTGTGEGITELLAGHCNLAMISRPLTEEEMNAGLWVVPVAKDGVAPIINQNNPHVGKIIDQGISPDEFMEIFSSGKQLTWGEILGTDSKDKINVYVRSDESGAAEIFAAFIYKKASDLKGTGVEGDYEMIRSIQEDPISIGFCNFSFAFDTVTGKRVKNIQVIPCDLDFDNEIDRVEVPFSSLEEAHRSLWLGFFPDQLCRELTLGSIGKPKDPLVIEFLNYVLGEGQKSIRKSGFCQLNNVYVEYARELLK